MISNSNAFPPASSATFAITADLCPQILCRLLGLIAQQSRLIERAEAQRAANSLQLRICVAGLEEHQAEILAEKMRSLVPVRHVWLSWVGSPALAPAARPEAPLRAHAPRRLVAPAGRAAAGTAPLPLQ